MRSKNPKPMAFTHKGQRYAQTGVDLYETASGREVRLLVFKTECPICDAPFELRVPRHRAEARSVVQRCPEHRMLGLTVDRHLAHFARSRQAREAAVLRMFD